MLLSDFLAINTAWVCFFWVRVESGWFRVVELNTKIDPSHLLTSSFFVYLLWGIGFTFFGLYRQWFVRPIFDEIVTILKTLALGTLLFLFFVLWGAFVGAEDEGVNDPRILGFVYFILLSFFTITFRLIVRFSQQRLLESGYGRRPSIILGDRANAESLAARVSHFPRLGYEVIGYVSPNGEVETGETRKLPRLGELKNLESIIAGNKIQEVLITLKSGDHDALLDVMGRTSGSNVGLKIMPDLYDIISGQARTREIYGFPLIDINPELQRPWEEATKRAMDIVASSIILVIGFPIWLLIALGVRVSSKGPMIYRQERVGRYGEPFNIYKFRSMRTDAEVEGPQWATKNDPRVTGYGRFLRRSHLDEIPQFFNVLKGDMSLVGPRPERAHFVQLLSKEIPYYPRRLRVRPGVTGLFQAMVYKYDENIDDVRNKLKYDLMYIESMSFRLDMKILFRTVYNVLRAGGQA